jgi:hypothetical protein
MRRLSCYAILVICPTLFAQTAEEKKLTIQYLRSLNQADGGFIITAQDPKLDQVPRSTLRATSAGIRALKYFGGELNDKKKTAAFVLSCYDPKSGAFADSPGGKPDVALTAVGMMAAAEVISDFDFSESTKFLLAKATTFEERRLAVAGMEASKKFPPALDEWFVEVKKSVNKDGTYGKELGLPRDTGGTIAMFLRAGKDIPMDERKAVINTLQAGQRTDGGYGKAEAKGSELETTYRVMRAFYLLKSAPTDVKALREYIAKCRNKDGGYGVEPGKPSAINSTYYAGIILHWLEK